MPPFHDILQRPAFFTILCDNIEIGITLCVITKHTGRLLLLTGDFLIENSLGNFFIIHWYFTSFQGRSILRKAETAFVSTCDLLPGYLTICY